jgi:hypothetical protein
MSESLRSVLEAEGGLLAGALGPPGDEASEDDLVVAAVREGQRLHAGTPRLVTGADPDLALLAGDRLYALGLERLAAAGDLEAVAALAEVIAHGAAALAQGDPQHAEGAWERLVRRPEGPMAGRADPPG